MPSPRRLCSKRSTLDESAARRRALGGGAHREAGALAGIQALAGIRAALAGALALAGVAGHALALRSIGGARRGDDGAGEEQGGGGGGERGAGLGIQLHDDLLDDCLKTKG